MNPMQLPINYMEWPSNTYIWSKAQTGKFGKDYFADELGQLSQGIIMVKGTNKVIFIPKTQVPKD